MGNRIHPLPKIAIDAGVAGAVAGEIAGNALSGALPPADGYASPSPTSAAVLDRAAPGAGRLLLSYRGSAGLQIGLIANLAGRFALLRPSLGFHEVDQLPFLGAISRKATWSAANAALSQTGLMFGLPSRPIDDAVISDRFESVRGDGVTEHDDVAAIPSGARYHQPGEIQEMRRFTYLLGTKVFALAPTIMELAETRHINAEGLQRIGVRQVENAIHI
jgi:hypothetical protein